MNEHQVVMDVTGYMALFPFIYFEEGVCSCEEGCLALLTFLSNRNRLPSSWADPDIFEIEGGEGVWGVCLREPRGFQAGSAIL